MTHSLVTFQSWITQFFLFIGKVNRNKFTWFQGWKFAPAVLPFATILKLTVEEFSQTKLQKVTTFALEDKLIGDREKLR